MFNSEKNYAHSMHVFPPVVSNNGILLPHRGNCICDRSPCLHVDGAHIKDPDGNTVILRGVSLIDIA